MNVHLCYWLIGARNRSQNIAVACDVHNAETSDLLFETCPELVRGTMTFQTRYRDARKAANAARRHVRYYGRQLARKGLNVTEYHYDRDSTDYNAAD